MKQVAAKRAKLGAVSLLGEQAGSPSLAPPLGRQRGLAVDPSGRVPVLAVWLIATGSTPMPFGPFSRSRSPQRGRPI